MNSAKAAPSIAVLRRHGGEPIARLPFRFFTMEEQAMMRPERDETIRMAGKEGMLAIVIRVLSEYAMHQGGSLDGCRKRPAAGGPPLPHAAVSSMPAASAEAPSPDPRSGPVLLTGRLTS